VLKKLYLENKNSGTHLKTNDKTATKSYEKDEHFLHTFDDNNGDVPTHQGRPLSYHLRMFFTYRGSKANTLQKRALNTTNYYRCPDNGDSLKVT